MTPEELAEIKRHCILDIWNADDRARFYEKDVPALIAALEEAQREIHRLENTEWDKGYIRGATNMQRDAVARARHHAEFCTYEADNGGHESLYERAKGANHLADVIASFPTLPENET